MENGWLGITDRSTLYELSRYEEVRPNVFSAGRDQHDDCVTSLLWGIYFLTTIFFDGKNLDIKTIDDKFLLQKEDDFETPVMILDDSDYTGGVDVEDESGTFQPGWGFEETGDEDFGSFL